MIVFRRREPIRSLMNDPRSSLLFAKSAFCSANYSKGGHLQTNSTADELIFAQLIVNLMKLLLNRAPVRWFQGNDLLPHKLFIRPQTQHVFVSGIIYLVYK
ncbi:hypothetical protein CDAR_282371 [Caerostris darwini]|uniref:Uncharacterized protein n=1 Tax=Caerostris darwini TaxID=1538125 RepID=A0AAV4MMT3_9ARAC|nr:hypothetical protein CDAR_282371 [Caerostris darwini]